LFKQYILEIESRSKKVQKELKSRGLAPSEEATALLNLLFDTQLRFAILRELSPAARNPRAVCERDRISRPRFPPLEFVLGLIVPPEILDPGMGDIDERYPIWVERHGKWVAGARYFRNAVTLIYPQLKRWGTRIWAFCTRIWAFCAAVALEEYIRHLIRHLFR
jgi:hypothetical protein